MSRHSRTPDRTALDARITQLALDAAAGSRPALGEFIRLTQPDVWRLVAHLSSVDQADDLTQETYLRAMDALPTFRGDAPARSWLLTIAHRTVVDLIRYEVARPSVARPADWLADRCHGRPTPDASARVELAAMLHSLDAERREALVLTQVLGFSYAEAAGIIGVPIGTIRSRVARARADLVTHWSDAAAHPDTDEMRLTG